MDVTLRFDQTSYEPGDPIGFTVDAGSPMQTTVTVEGVVITPDGQALKASATTTVYGQYGPFTADGYRIEQDGDDPARFLATPASP